MPKDKLATHADNDPKYEMSPISSPDEQALKRARYREYRFQAMQKFDVANNARKRYDWEWLVRDLFRRGYQFSRYNPSNRTVILSTRSMVKIPINLLWAQMRTIKNQVVSFKPKWDVMPDGNNEESLNNARYSTKLLDHYYDILNLRKIIKETVIQGLICSVGGPWQIGYDPEADNGQGEVYIWLLDPFDFYIDPSATKLEDAEYVIKAVRRPLDEIKTNPNYKFYGEAPQHGEQKQAASEYKQFLLQTLKYQTGYAEQNNNAILRECWSKVRINKENKDELSKELRENDQNTNDLRQGEVLMRVTTYLDFLNDPLRVQLIRRSDYPFILYQADINPMEIYGESWAKHVIPMNRVLNALESSVFQYNYKYAKGRIVIDKNSGVRMFSNEHGDIVEKNQGSEVSSMPLQPLPVSYQMQIENMRRYIEDIGGAHDVSLGRIPTGIKSGIGIAELKQADATNQTDLVDNLEDFLVLTGKKLLREIAQNYDVPKIIKALGKSGKPEHFVVVGEKAGKGRKNKKEVKIGTDVFNIAIIGQDSQVSVKIGSWLSYTKEAQHEKLKEYYQAGLIDQKTFLEHAEFSDVDNIVEETRKEETLKKFRGAPSATEPAVTDEEVAEQENIIMVNEGRDAKVSPDDNHQVHLVVHQEHADNPLVSAHMLEHERMAKFGESPMSSVSQPATTVPTPGVAGASPIGSTPTMAMPVAGPMGQQPQPASTEEQALMQSLQSITGGQ